MAEPQQQPGEPQAAAPGEGIAAVEYALTHFPYQPVRVECRTNGEIKQVQKLAADYGRTVKISQPRQASGQGSPMAWPAIVEVQDADPVNGVQHVRMGQ